jgi:hypothetical protein
MFAGNARSRNAFGLAMRPGTGPARRESDKEIELRMRANRRGDRVAALSCLLLDL